MTSQCRAWPQVLHTSASGDDVISVELIPLLRYGLFFYIKTLHGSMMIINYNAIFMLYVFSLATVYHKIHGWHDIAKVFTLNNSKCQLIHVQYDRKYIYRLLSKLIPC